MQVIIHFTTEIDVIRDIGDPRFSNKDSWFLHRVKKELQAMGYDCIKKLAYKDGNLVNDDMHYIRSRKGSWYVYDPMHNIRSCAHAFDTEGIVHLSRSGALK